MALAVTADTAAWPHDGRRRFASLEEQKTLWWCRDGGLAQASSKIVRVALDRGGRAACAAADGTIYALAPHLRGAAREWRCVAQTKTNVPLLKRGSPSTAPGTVGYWSRRRTVYMSSRRP